MENKIIKFDINIAKEHPDWIMTKRGENVEILKWDWNGIIIGIRDDKNINRWYPDGTICGHGTTTVKSEKDLVLCKPIENVDYYVYTWKMTDDTTPYVYISGTHNTLKEATERMNCFSIDNPNIYDLQIHKITRDE